MQAFPEVLTTVAFDYGFSEVPAPWFPADEGEDPVPQSMQVWLPRRCQCPVVCRFHPLDCIPGECLLSWGTRSLGCPLGTPCFSSFFQLWWIKSPECHSPVFTSWPLNWEFQWPLLQQMALLSLSLFRTVGWISTWPLWDGKMGPKFHWNRWQNLPKIN